MKNRTAQSGFTLIELMLAASISLIAVLSCGMMIANMMTNSRRNLALLQLNRTAQQVFVLCEEGIRTATVDDVNDSNGDLVVGGDKPFIIRQNGKSLVYDNDPANDGDTTLAAGAVEDFTVTIVEGPARVHLRLLLIDPEFSELSYEAEYDVTWRNTNDT